MKLTNKQNLPMAIIEGIKKDRENYLNSYGGKLSDISVTEMIAPPQIRVLKKKHKDEITEDASDCLWAFFGSAVHAYLDIASSSGISEHRVFYTDMALGMMLSGMFDLLDEEILYEYKLMSVWSVINGVKPEHEAQLNVLDFLADHDDMDIVNELKIVAMLRDWSASEAEYNKSYPQHQIMLMPVRKWTRDQQAKYIHERLQLHQEADNGIFVPECTDEERWASPEVFACMRNKNKKSSKNCSTNEEAEKWIESKPKPEEYKIVVRPREYRRCDKYCSVAPFCEQYQQTKEEQNGISG